MVKQPKLSYMFQSKFWKELGVQLGIPNAQNGGRELARDSGKERFSLGELEKLYDILASNPSIHESNRSVVVETIRSIAEVSPCHAASPQRQSR